MQNKQKKNESRSGPITVPQTFTIKKKTRLGD